MLTYGDVKQFLTDGLAANYETGNAAGQPGVPRTMPMLHPGPVLPGLMKLTPGPLVFATVGNGAGMVVEQTYDQVFITVRSIGPQNDYDSSEKMAQDIDLLFLRINSPAMIGSTRVLYVTRTGGAPQLVDFDEANRYHFQTTYITPASTGL